MGHDEVARRLQEREAVRTTIVGGRPPGSGKSIGEIPRGIEVLLKKAAVDAAFREQLLEQRAEAAAQIGLTLTASEAAMLKLVPRAQLEKTIEGVPVPASAVPALMGKVALVMLAALGITQSACGDEFAPSKGIRPEDAEDLRGRAATQAQPATAPANQPTTEPIVSPDQVRPTRGLRVDRPATRPQTQPVTQPAGSPVPPQDVLFHPVRGLRPEDLQ